MRELLIRQDAPRSFLGLPGIIQRADIAERVEAAVARFEELARVVSHLGLQIALYYPQGDDPFGADGEPFWLGRETMGRLDVPTGLQLN